jgi:uncharacterized protein
MYRHPHTLSIMAASWLIGFGWNAQSASFDCAGSRSDVEVMICTNPTLSADDEAMAHEYQMALENYPDPNMIRRDQGQWLVVRNQCPDAACIEAAYKRRFAQLESLRRPWTPGCTGGVSVCLGERW